MSGMDRVQQTVANKCSRKQGVAERAWQEGYRGGVRSAE